MDKELPPEVGTGSLRSPLFEGGDIVAEQRIYAPRAGRSSCVVGSAVDGVSPSERAMSRTRGDLRNAGRNSSTISLYCIGMAIAYRRKNWR